MSREKKFTPGPWSVNSKAIEFRVGKTGRNGLSAVACGILTIDDANLVAAAPELLEALEEVIELQYDERKNSCYIKSKKSWVNDNYRATDKAKSAIKKAYGDTK